MRLVFLDGLGGLLLLRRVVKAQVKFRQQTLRLITPQAWLALLLDLFKFRLVENLNFLAGNLEPWMF